MKIAFVGAGNMAAALIGGMIERGMAAQDIVAMDPYEAARTRCESDYGVTTYDAIGDVIADCDMVVLSVKPQTLNEACARLKPYLTEQVIVSIAAGVRLHDIARWLGDYGRIVRAMPNTPALIGQGATGAFAASAVSEREREAASRVLQAVGLVEWVASEAVLDSVTAISGSGPAYVFYFIEALEEAGRTLGLSPEQARKLAVATFSGAASLALNSSEPAATLRERVTSKGGTTAAALASFEASGVKDAIVRGAQAASRRSVELGEELGAP